MTAVDIDHLQSWNGRTDVAMASGRWRSAKRRRRTRQGVERVERVTSPVVV